MIDAPLDARHRDYALMGKWTDYRDCHVKPSCRGETDLI
ncbi:type II toxin-antitoxin system YafQ family toxin [Komagataeibacter saccharivorans]|nr:type II toxin-antitoxin system YafQ family toxin [Komagataeibacter saccharivorans]